VTKTLYTVRLKKFNQDHEADGRFGGPGTSHQPTGRPAGRPGLSAGQIAGGVAASQAGSIAAGWAGSKVGSVAGGALGTALGAAIPVLGELGIGEAIGQKTGAIVGGLLGSVAGDYVGTKIGSALIGIKELKDQHKIATGAAVGELAAGTAAYGLSRLLPGGNAVRALFDFGTTELGAHAATGAIETAGGVAGGLAGAKSADNSKALQTGGKIASRVGTAKKVGKVVRGLTKSRYVQSRLAKSFFDKPPASYASSGSFGSMATASLPHLFGPKAWAQVSGTKFGGYIRQRVKDVAEKMDDAAAARGLDLTPAKEQDIMPAAQALQQADQQQGQQNQAAQQQQQLDLAGASAPKHDHTHMAGSIHADQMTQAAPAPSPGAPSKGGLPGAGGPGKPSGPPAPIGKLFVRKLFALPMRSPNDVVSRDISQSGGPASVAFLHRVQTAESQSRQIQLNRSLAQPKIQNLARAPGEDEEMYRNRMQTVMRASVKNTDRLKPSMFSTNAGASEAGLSGLPPNQQTQRYTVTMKKHARPDWTISAVLAKEWNTAEHMEQGLVYGWASIIEKDGITVTDHEGDRITSSELVKAAHNFIAKSRQGGVLHDEYGHNIGHIVESVVFTKELQDHLGIDLGKVGWLIGYQITDGRVKMLAKAGLFKSFSIGGRGRRVPVNEN